MNKYSNKQIITVVIFVVFSLLLVLFVIPKISRMGKYSIEIVTAPADTDISLDNKSLSRGANYLSPGSYTIIFSRTDFSSLELDVTVSEENSPLTVVLTPVNAAGEKVLFNDPAFDEVEGIVGIQAEKEGREFIDNNPIVSYLPYRSGLFNIDYRLKEGSSSEIVVIITVHKLEKDFAHDQLLEWGFSLDDLEIEYRDWQLVNY